MTDHPAPDSRHRDDELAGFTDRLLDGNGPDAENMSTQDEELLELQGMVVRLKRAFGTGGPDEATARRIRAGLVKEWRRLGPTVQTDANPPRLRWPALLRPTRQRAYALSFLAVVMVVGVLALYLSQGASGGSALTGTARGQVAPLPLALLLGLTLTGILWWVIQKERS